MKDVCAYCGHDLSKVSEIHSVEGKLFCSKDCAINYQIDEIIKSSKEAATAWYNDCAEVVTPEDIGIEK